MKSFITTLFSLFLCTVVFAQSEQYSNAMKAYLLKLKDAKTPESFQAAANGFERIAGSEQKEWLPKYYAAFCFIMQAMNTADKDKVDGILDQADKLVVDALMIINNDEILCLQSLSASARIGVNPMTRGMKYGQISAGFLAKAKELNPDNPRIYYLEATAKYYTPKAFGGGKDKAKELFEKAVVAYSKFKPANELMPDWGAEQTMQLLEECRK